MEETGKGTVGRIGTILLAAAILALPQFSTAAEKGRVPTPGQPAKGLGEGHGGMLSMGEKLWRGRIGPWKGQARLLDRKTQAAKAKASGKKMEAPMTKSHRVLVMLLNAKEGTPVLDGKGALTVTGPDRKPVKSALVMTDGAFSTEIDLPNPGEYEFLVWIEAGGKTGSVAFKHTMK